jgi:hypothetical protein
VIVLYVCLVFASLMIVAAVVCVLIDLLVAS